MAWELVVQVLQHWKTYGENIAALEYYVTPAHA